MTFWARFFRGFVLGNEGEVRADKPLKAEAVRHQLSKKIQF